MKAQTKVRIKDLASVVNPDARNPGRADYISVCRAGQSIYNTWLAPVEVEYVHKVLRLGAVLHNVLQLDELVFLSVWILMVSILTMICHIYNIY